MNNGCNWTVLGSEKDVLDGPRKSQSGLSRFMEDKWMLWMRRGYSVQGMSSGDGG